MNTKYYAVENGITRKFVDGAIEITEDEFVILMEKLDQGEYIDVSTGKIETYTAEEVEYVLEGVLHKEYLKKGHLPKGAELYVIDNFYVDELGLHRKKDDNYLINAKIQKYKASIEILEKKQLRPLRELELARTSGEDTTELIKLIKNIDSEIVELRSKVNDLLIKASDKSTS